MSAADAVVWLARLGAIATALAAIELLVAHRALSERGVFAWSVLRRDLPLPGWLLGERGIVGVLVVQLAAAIAIALWPAPWPPLVAFACVLLVAMRFRGSFNGGSDSMLLVVLLALVLVHASPRITLGYAAGQLVASYVLAGIAKLGEPAWRSGRALAALVALPGYRVPARLARIAAHRVIGPLASYAILAFELAFPLVFVHPHVAYALLTVGAAFHIANALVFGLSRFTWMWLAAYPALLYWTT